MYEIREEPFMDKFDSLSALYLEHWMESAKNKELMVFNPDRNKYQTLEDQGLLLCLFAYKNGVIVGYSINILSQHLHYVDVRCAYNDLIFIDANSRNSPLGIRLIKETKKAAKTKGCNLLLWHAKAGSNLDKILPRLGCNHHENIYTEVL
jgi:hypothetical protein